MHEFSSLVVLNGDVPRGFAAAVLWTLSQQVPRPQIIAADGGGAALLAQEIRPDILIGDGDSLAQNKREILERQGVRRYDLPCAKDFGDGEAALKLALEQNQGQVALFGAFGGRLDFTIANLTLPLLFGSQQARRVVFFGHDFVAHYAEEDEVIRGKEGDAVSFLSLSPEVTGLSLNGFAYPLNDYILKEGSSRCISNIMKEKLCNVRHRDGELLVIQYRKENY
ncbi:MAG: thiamine diphosphokinase [Clostridiales bacterium]